MEKKVGYIIAAYFGKRQYPHKSYEADMSFYVKIQLEQIKKMKLNFHKIYIMCTFDTNADKDGILSKINEYSIDFDNVIIQTRENLGGSYCSWKDVLLLDDNECDYMVLTEDDYTMTNENSISNMVKYFDDYPGVFTVCAWWTDKPYTVPNLRPRITVPNHAAFSMSIMDNKMYNKLREDGIDFRLNYNPASYIVMWENQALYLEPYREAGIPIMDFRERHSVLFGGDVTKTIEYGNPNEESIFLPIQGKFF